MNLGRSARSNQEGSNLWQEVSCKHSCLIGNSTAGTRTGEFNHLTWQKQVKEEKIKKKPTQHNKYKRTLLHFSLAHCGIITSSDGGTRFVLGGTKECATCAI
ncbi:hypothetical protein CpipJ_CPIJ018860 [Culex quinquefasciatus]|uniref:Uncharacterized protein n=1 Tax=Culex quinquefasciatus TaxID=7176 RepID=B0XII5_CULQU|nr:hypothetical protein CpipJ_CPIJ018860 [Culex quinquefasciatus]|eukprot:XP_001869457.1 hypothetical protein CpipJ_CPIJ018860 [Culex quinquefasciatus]